MCRQLTAMLRMSYEPPRMGPSRLVSADVACGEAGVAPSGKPEQDIVRSTMTVAPP